MKKIIFFVILLVLWNTTAHCYQFDNPLFTKDVSEVRRIKTVVTVVGMPSIPSESLRKQLSELNDAYSYTTDNADEINILMEYINSFELADDASDYECKLFEPLYFVTIEDKQGENYILFNALQTEEFTYITTYEEEYIINNDEWNEFLVLVNTLKRSAYFSDICDETNNIKTAVGALADAGIVNGIANTKFAPNNNLRRAEVVMMISRMIEKETSTIAFVDVERSAWYYNAVAECVNCGIVDGFEDNTFRGEETVSELQLVCLASRALRSEGTAQETDKTYIASTDNIPDWAKSDVEYAVINGIITEDEAETLSEKEMTRGEAAVILYRLYHVI